MEADFVNAFLDGTIETFDTMCEERPERCGPLELRNSMIQTFELFSTIGLSGPFRAAFVLTMNRDVALAAVTAFVGEEMTEIDEESLDAMGELVNIVAGAASAKFEGTPIDLSLPTVMLAQNRWQYASAMNPWVVIPMRFPNWGQFNIELSLIEE